MPKGPKGEKRPADVIGNAIKVDKGEDAAAVSLGSRGGKARADALSKRRRAGQSSIFE
jgi:hypothetical protein